jgi:FkbM family methyltransferase
MFNFSPLRDARRVVGLRMALLLRLGHWVNFGLRNLGIKYRHPLLLVQVKGYVHPVWGRLGSSDLLVLDQIFIQQEYAPLDSMMPAPKWMIDCGANVGYSSIYFLNRYPDLKLIIVEPNIDNLSLCRKNLASYSNQIQIIHKGVWSRPASLVLSGAGWSTQVREAAGQETPDIEATDIPSLLAQIPDGEVDLLKIDIERSELSVFGHPHTAWLSKVRNIVIELHDEQCEAVFFKALEPYEYDLSRSGELTFCKNIRLRAAKEA